MSSRRLPPALLALSPGDLSSARVPGFLARVERALAAGLRGLLLREPGLADRDMAELGRDLRTRLDAVAGWLAVHDRAHLVAPCAADGLHLGFRSLEARACRTLVGEGVAIGVSTHRGDDPALWQAADYRFFGPLRPVAGKSLAGVPVGLAEIADAVDADPLPLWVLGGVRAEDLSGLGRCAVSGVAVLSGVLGAADPARATRAYLEALALPGAAAADRGQALP